MFPSLFDPAFSSISKMHSSLKNNTWILCLLSDYKPSYHRPFTFVFYLESYILLLKTHKNIVLFVFWSKLVLRVLPHLWKLLKRFGMLASCFVVCFLTISDSEKVNFDFNGIMPETQLLLWNIVYLFLLVIKHE